MRGNRRRRQHQQIDRLALARQRQPLVHAEAVLLVDDGKREVAERNLVLEQRMGADQEIDLAGGQRRQDFGAFAAALAPGEKGDADADGSGERRDGGERCWRARISVGAMKAAWRPASITVAAASSATTVLPEPTSPCSRRSMRLRLRQVGDDVGAPRVPAMA